MQRLQRPRFAGNFNYANESGINGWLLDRQNPEDRIKFNLFVNGTLKGGFVAARVREKINANGAVSRRIGFHLQISSDWNLSNGAIITVQPCAFPDFHLTASFQGAAETREAAEQSVEEGPAVASPDHLSRMVHGTLQKAILPTLKHHTDQKNWPEIANLNRVLVLDVPQFEKSLLYLGRGSLYAREYLDAQRTLSIACVLYPDFFDAQYYCGVAFLRSGDYDTAISYLSKALEIDENSLRAKKDLADALERSVRRLPREGERSAIEIRALTLLLEVIAAQPSVDVTMRAARLAFDQNRFEQALELFEIVLAERPDHVQSLASKSRCLVGLQRISEALATARRIAEIDPNNETARYQLRILRFLSDEDENRSEARAGLLTMQADGAFRLDDGEGTAALLLPASPFNDAANQLSNAGALWLEVVAEGAAADRRPPFPQRLGTRFGCHKFRNEDDGVERVFWHRDALAEIVRSTRQTASLSHLDRFERLHLPAHQPPSPGDTVIVMSRHGIVKFGGGEHFIASMADHYESIGLNPIIVGHSTERAGETGTLGGRRFAFVSDHPSSLRALVLSTHATLVHGISGTGMQCASALELMNVQFIYGVHFWREALGSDAGDAFFDDGGAPLPRPEFEFVLTRASTVYANSDYTRQVLDKAFGVRCPVVYSVPRDLEMVA